MQRILTYLLCFFLLISYQSTLLAIEEPSKLHICTVASHETQGLKQLLDSCERQGVNITILGLRKPFPGLSGKLLYVQEY